MAERLFIINTKREIDFLTKTAEERYAELLNASPEVIQNINVAINNLPAPGGLPAEPWYVWSRLAFQPIYIAWVWWAAIYADKRITPHVKKTARVN